MIRSYVYGFILNLQFFTTIPLIKKTIPMKKVYIRRAVQLFPLLGLLQGLIYTTTLYLLQEWTFLSSLAIALILWILLIIITGGIHLDGWIDTSDAIFSYRDQAKRIKILSDPHIGAFGLISAIVLLFTRFIFIYEIVERRHFVTYLLILLLPFLSKIIMGILITFVSPLKETGLGFMFHRASTPDIIVYYCLYIILIYSGMLFFQQQILLLLFIFLVVTCSLGFLFYRWIKRIFGGATGDLIGSATEGTEWMLWLTLWLYHYIVMG